MKRLLLKGHVQQTLFFLIVLISLLGVFPVYHLISGKIHDGIESYCHVLKEKTGLELSYESMSPSLLTGLRLNKVSLTDSFNGQKILGISSLTIHYDFLKLIFGKPAKSIKDITIDGIDVDIDENGNSALIAKIKNLSETAASDEEGKKFSLNVKEMVDILSMRLLVKNINVNYGNSEGKVRAVLQKVQFDFQPENGRIIIATDGYCKWNSVKTEDYAALNFEADGNITQIADGSSFTITVSNFENESYSVSKLNLLLMYNDKVLSFQTVHNSYPLLLIGNLQTDTGEIGASLKTENLRYGDIFKSKKPDDAIEKLNDFFVSIQADVQYDFSSNDLNYSSFGDIKIPSSIITDGADFKYNLNGNLALISVPELSVEGKNIKAESNFDFNFRTFTLQGEGILYNYVFDNGAELSTEFYFDSLEKGFVCYAPQIMMDDQTLTAMQLQVVPEDDSFGFSFEVSDYSHQEASEPGKISIEGSYLKASSYVQANLSVHGLFLDSLAEKGIFFTESRNYKMAEVFNPFMMNGEAYLSSDLESFSFNIPYFVVADTSEKDRYLFVSLDGTSSSLNISRFSYISGDSVTTINAELDKSPDSNDAFFTADVTSSLIPYHFSGNIMENYVQVNGDYDFSFEMNYGNGFEGKLSCLAFPIQKDQTIIGLSLDSSFYYNNLNDFLFTINKVEAEEVSDTLAVKPHLLASGSVSKYGAVFDNISYSDKISTLFGKSELLWNINDGRFDSASLDFSIASENNWEKLNVTCDVSNPLAQDISFDALMHSFFFSAQINSSNFNLSRIGGDRSPNNGMTGTISMSGTLDAPYIGIDIEKIEFMIIGKLIKASLRAYLEDNKVVVENASVEYNKVWTKDFKASFDLKSWTGNAEGTVETYVSDRTLIVPFKFNMFNSVVLKDSVVPSEFIAKVEFPDIHGSLLKTPLSFDMTLMKSEDRATIISSPEIGISGNVMNNGNVDLHVDSSLSTKADISGFISATDINLSMTNIQADFGRLFSNTSLTDFEIHKGFAKGALKVSGIISDPEFIGALSVSGFDFSLPKIIPYHIVVDKTLLTVDEKEVIMAKTKGIVKGSASIFAQMNLYFDRWDIDFIKARVWTDNNFCPADFDAGAAEFRGDANVDLDLFFQDNYLDVKGFVNVRKTKAWVKTNEFTSLPSFVSEGESAPKSSYVRSDLKITLENHVNFTLDPLLRVVFVPDSVVYFKYDEEENSYSMDGTINFKTGDVSYLNRNFYLKSGSLKFNGNDSAFDPLITVEAETRERDEEGNNLLISLSAKNQYFSEFEPQISSIPAKSELELRQILGQIVIGDSDDVASFLVSTGDYALQSTVGRTIEGKLRDLFNFDILSIRTMILQNALKQSISSDKNKKSLEIGNFLDNSTVYIGKYFGSSLYVDALLHWSYDENRVDDKTTTGGLVFKPEIGLEIESPLANIRWNMAPDIDALMNSRIVPSTSVTLSWKFTF